MSVPAPTGEARHCAFIPFISNLVKLLVLYTLGMGLVLVTGKVGWRDMEMDMGMETHSRTSISCEGVTNTAHAIMSNCTKIAKPQTATPCCPSPTDGVSRPTMAI